MKRISRVLLSLSVIVASGWVCLSLGFAGLPPLATENCDTNGDQTKDLSAIQINTAIPATGRCHDIHWVPFCNQ